ncbi:hypothetical protein J5N97_021208 [Dioscorea zingiberensis]|uniref:Uncharacterized protein n=1 Tax=Dioscorea zingiberensis TaxID=325984 RepID=A0A9D5HE35_9LILI|nr:hypothetical protein J5N97_021208 [Dioscorea zingiberensis]
MWCAEVACGDNNRDEVEVGDWPLGDDVAHDADMANLANMANEGFSCVDMASTVAPGVDITISIGVVSTMVAASSYMAPTCGTWDLHREGSLQDGTQCGGSWDPFIMPRSSNLSTSPKLLSIKSLASSHDQSSQRKSKSRLENILSTAASLYPVYVTAGGALACVKPSAFSWFVHLGPASYSFSLAFIMLVMGLTLELKDLLGLFKQRPFAILFGCLAQYTIMPAFGAIVSRALGLSPSLSVGLILLGCCPTGTASNVVTLIAQGDVPLSIVMTICTTFAAVLATPLLTQLLAGTYVPVDALKLSLSTLQVVVAPILLGSYMQSRFPSLVKVIVPFSPLLAVLTSSLLASSVFSENVARLKSSIMISDLVVVIQSVLLLHFAGFFVGYLVSSIAGFGERQRRAISIEVGMQNSALGVVLATSHFSSPLVALPAALSAVIMNIMGSTLGFIWRYIDPSDTKTNQEFTSK